MFKVPPCDRCPVRQGSLKGLSACNSLHRSLSQTLYFVEHGNPAMELARNADLHQGILEPFVRKAPLRPVQLLIPHAVFWQHNLLHRRDIDWPAGTRYGQI